MRTIAVALAVALVTAGGAGAAFIVTSKQIKDGTIQLRDISPGAKLGLRGIGRTSTVTGNLVNVRSGGEAEATASCLSGKLVGGGWIGDQYLSVTRSVASGQTWTVRVVNRGALGDGFSAQAICAY